MKVNSDLEDEVIAPFSLDILDNNLKNWTHFTVLFASGSHFPQSTCDSPRRNRKKFHNFLAKVHSDPVTAFNSVW